MITLIVVSIVSLILAIIILPSFKYIGPTEVGLVNKRFSMKSNKTDNPIVFSGEAGYQAKLLMPGVRFNFWIVYGVKKYPWIQIPAGEIGIVISQIGKPLPMGAKSAVFKKEFGNFTNVNVFIDNDGQKGLQRPVLPPGTLIPIHPVAFLVISKEKIYGQPVEDDLLQKLDNKEVLSCNDFGLEKKQLNVVRIVPCEGKDYVGVITTHDGNALDKGDIANRLGGYEDVKFMEENNKNDAEIIETLLGSKNLLHDNYQDFQAFIDNGGRIGLQHDPLLYGSFNLNPFLVSVENVEMLVVEQGEVAVIKSYVGLVTKDTSGASFKFGSIVKPGHRGVSQEPLRTGKYPINPRCYQSVIVPTSILTLNWADTNSKAHDLDVELSQIEAKSKEGFVFKLDLQVQIHVSDTEAPKVISMVGSMQNLINEVLQAAVGNHFRDKLQSLQAIEFIEQRQKIQKEANIYITEKLKNYNVETRGVYIQDVILPEDIVNVLKEREIAHQEISTYKKQREAEEERIAMEMSKGKADKQNDLAASEIEIKIKSNYANARKSEASGEATYISETGAAKAAEVKSKGIASAEGYQKQVDALGKENTTFVNIVTALANGNLKLPENMVLNFGQNGGGSPWDIIPGPLAKIIKGNNTGGLLQSLTDAKSEPVVEKSKKSKKND